MSLSVRVVDLDHHRSQLPVNVAQVEACRVEHVAEDTKICDQRDAASVEIDASCPQMGANVAWQVDGRLGQMVRVWE